MPSQKTCGAIESLLEGDQAVGQSWRHEVTAKLSMWHSICSQAASTWFAGTDSMITPIDPKDTNPTSCSDPAAVPANGSELANAGPLRRFLQKLGPGLITGASDDDPSGISTYSMAGAALGYSILWTALLTFPLMAGVQFICSKIGHVSGHGLAGVLRRHYPRVLLYPAVLGLLVANTINAGADLGAIAAGINLLVPLPISWLIVPIGLALLVLQIWGSYRLIANTFKWLTLALFAYIGAAFFANPDAGEILRGTLVPTVRFDGPYLAILVAILGTTISPYLFFWQASQEVEEDKATGRRVSRRAGSSDACLRDSGWDVRIGMLLSNTVMYFIILTTAATLNVTGPTEITSAEQAAEALRPLAGNAATALMALGLIGTGCLAVPILTGSAAYAASESFGWRHGLDRPLLSARPFYAVMAGSTVVALLLNFVGIDPVQALFWTAVINGFLSPPLLVLVMLIANNRTIMGDRVNGPLLNILGWTTTLLMFAAALGLVLT
jgi:NRAMP (natural resistance-associated macrophage protein)-like metal ion transporter